MKISGAFPSKYIKCPDLGGRRHRLLMGQVVMEEVERDKDNMPVLHFQNAAKGLVLNKTNANTIATVYGDDTDRWFGQLIEIFPSVTDFQGRQVDCVRVQRPVDAGPDTMPPVQPGTLGASMPPLKESTIAAGGAPVGPSENPGAGLDLNDDVPFAPMRELP